VAGAASQGLASLQQTSHGAGGGGIDATNHSCCPSSTGPTWVSPCADAYSTHIGRSADNNDEMYAYLRRPAGARPRAAAVTTSAHGLVVRDHDGREALRERVVEQVEDDRRVLRAEVTSFICRRSASGTAAPTLSHSCDGLSSGPLVRCEDRIHTCYEQSPCGPHRRSLGRHSA
jgi:hypothetical protein